MECLIKIQKLLEKGSHDLQCLATDFTGLLNPHVQVTLLGWAYAFYFSPRDLILASDPWFVRRHQFFDASSGKETIWAPTQVCSYVSGGSYLSGGLAQIAATAGEVGLVGRDAGGSVGSDTASSKMAAMQLASLRSIPWAAVDEHGPRQLALKSLFGRELLAEAIRNPEVQAELSEPLLHLIGLRRAKVYQALANHPAFRLLSISDLIWVIHSGGVTELRDGQTVRSATHWSRRLSASATGKFRGSECTRPRMAAYALTWLIWVLMKTMKDSGAKIAWPSA
jgi:hypothetical protein